MFRLGFQFPEPEDNPLVTASNSLRAIVLLIALQTFAQCWTTYRVETGFRAIHELAVQSAKESLEAVGFPSDPDELAKRFPRKTEKVETVIEDQ